MVFPRSGIGRIVRNALWHAEDARLDARNSSATQAQSSGGAQSAASGAHARGGAQHKPRRATGAYGQRWERSRSQL